MGLSISLLQKANQRKNSHSIPNSEVKKNGCFTTLPVRRNICFTASEDIESKIAHDWENTICDGLSKYSCGGSNPIFGGWDALILPEANPERLRHSMWMTKFFFLVDDKADTMTPKEAHETLNQGIDSIMAKETESELNEPPVSPMEKLLIPFIKDLLSCDRDRGVHVLREWRYWLQNVDKKSAKEIHTIDEYLQYRTVNIGMRPYAAMIRYSMELDLSLAELQSVKDFQRAVWVSVTLSNDYWSWPKEVASANNCKHGIMNAVSILMRSQGLNETHARHAVKRLSIESEKNVSKLFVNFISKSSPKLSQPLKTFLQAHLWIIAGNSLWSSTCPRYNKDTL